MWSPFLFLPTSPHNAILGLVYPLSILSEILCHFIIPCQPLFPRFLSLIISKFLTFFPMKSCHLHSTRLNHRNLISCTFVFTSIFGVIAILNSTTGLTDNLYPLLILQLTLLSYTTPLIFLCLNYWHWFLWFTSAYTTSLLTTVGSKYLVVIHLVVLILVFLDS